MNDDKGFVNSFFDHFNDVIDQMVGEALQELNELEGRHPNLMGKEDNVLYVRFGDNA